MKILTDNKLLLKILSALIAVILWIAITYSEDPLISQVVAGINVEFEGEDILHENGLVVTNKEKFPDISVKIRGNRSKVISSIGSITAVCDVSKITTAGESVIPVKYSYPQTSITLLKSKVSEVKIETEKIVTRIIPVRLEVSNRDKNSEQIVSSKSRVESVLVRGAESQVYRISYAKAAIDVSNVLKTSSQEYMFEFYDSDNNKIDGNDIVYKNHNTITVDNTVYKRITVPVSVVLGEKISETHGIVVKDLSKTKIDVGVKPGNNIDEVVAVLEEPNLQEADSYELTISDIEDVFIPEESKKITATCEVVPKITKEIEVSVSVKNIAEGKTATLAESKKLISVKGIEKLIAPANIEAWVDAGELSDGKSNAPVIIEPIEGLVVLGSYFAEVEIK